MSTKEMSSDYVLRYTIKKSLLKFIKLHAIENLSLKDDVINDVVDIICHLKNKNKTMLFVNSDNEEEYRKKYIIATIYIYSMYSMYPILIYAEDVNKVTSAIKEMIKKFNIDENYFFIYNRILDMNNVLEIGINYYCIVDGNMMNEDDSFVSYLIVNSDLDYGIVVKDF